MNKPFRVWMTSGLAMVIAAFSNGAFASAGDERLVLAGFSRYDLRETVTRIEAVAQQRGLPVLMRLPQSARDGQREVIVLESSEGGTPVAMDSAHARPDLLLSVVVRQAQDGSTQVLLPQRVLLDAADGLSVPDGVRIEVAGLSVVVAQALA
jgi:hypothetical protein